MWWIYVVVVVVLVLGVWGFVSLVRFYVRLLGRRGNRTAESMYDNYADERRPKD